MFDLLVFISAVALIVLGASLGVSILVGNMLKERSYVVDERQPVCVDGVWHAAYCNKAVNTTWLCSCAPELEEHTYEESHEERVTVVMFLKDCVGEYDYGTPPLVSYRSVNPWIVGVDGEAYHA